MACKTKQIMTGHLTYSLMKLQSAKLWLNAEEHTTFMLFIFIRQKYYELYAKLFQTIVSVVLVVIFWMSFNFYIFIFILEVIFHLHSSFYLNLFLFRF